jgi:hypothetical protein
MSWYTNSDGVLLNLDAFHVMRIAENTVGMVTDTVTMFSVIGDVITGESRFEDDGEYEGISIVIEVFYDRQNAENFIRKQLLKEEPR